MRIFPVPLLLPLLVLASPAACVDNDGPPATGAATARLDMPAVDAAVSTLDPAPAPPAPATPPARTQDAGVDAATGSTADAAVDAAADGPSAMCWSAVACFVACGSDTTCQESCYGGLGGSEVVIVAMQPVAACIGATTCTTVACAAAACPDVETVCAMF